MTMIGRVAPLFMQTGAAAVARLEVSGFTATYVKDTQA